MVLGPRGQAGGMTAEDAPRVLLVAQWPSIKNAEYELAERIRRTGFKIQVVDFLGFDVHTGRCINGAHLRDEFDFALAFHYETPKFLNLPTFLWVANPLEFLQAQGNYRTHLIHHLRSYDDYLYNGSDFLKEHIQLVVGEEWTDSGLGFFQSCSRNAIISPRPHDEADESARKLFYCGVNWEAISDKEGRAQGLLEILQERQAADFYGPKSILGVDVWAPFPSYRGEIPFDGHSIFPEMNRYAAVLAVSSPAHIKSRTSSGRVMEGFAAGVPVISDENPHVRSQFGDLAYYFAGATESERADSIQAAMEDIRTRPAQAIERVREAQELLSSRYCFEVCLEGARDAVVRKRHGRVDVSREPAPAASQARIVDVFVFLHDPYPHSRQVESGFPNLEHVVDAIERAVALDNVRFRVLHAQPVQTRPQLSAAAAAHVEWVDLSADIDAAEWAKLRMGEKLARLAALSTGDYAAFFTQSAFPQYDYFEKSIEWLSPRPSGGGALHIAGFYVNEFTTPAPLSAAGILRNNCSVGLYRWTQDSIAQHQFSQLCFNREALAALRFDRLRRFDVLLPVAIILDCQSRGDAIHRSRHLLLRMKYGYYHSYFEAFERAARKGMWAQQYELLSNATHEIHGLYDAFHETPAAVAIADKIYGIDIPPPVPPVPLDPALDQVTRFMHRISPYVVRVKSVGRFFGIR